MVQLLLDTKRCMRQERGINLGRGHQDQISFKKASVERVGRKKKMWPVLRGISFQCSRRHEAVDLNNAGGRDITFMIGKLKHRQKRAYLYIPTPVSVSGFKNKWSSYAYDVTALF